MGGKEKKILQRARNEIMGNYAGLDLLQNCDLPPPSKVFVGPDKTVMLSMNRVVNTAGKQQQPSKDCATYRVENGGGGDDDGDKVELLKALQASQTRAREAEKKAVALRRERDGLSVALVDDAMRLFAFRQHVRLLELQVLHLQSLSLQQQRQQPGAVGSSNEDGYGEERSSVAWVLALALTLGIGVTTAIACKYLL